MRKIRTYHDVDTGGSAEVLEQVVAQQGRLAHRLSGIRHVVAVASGKGGVGKSAVTANLSAVLRSRGHAVGALDADLAGPSLGRMTGVAGQRLTEGEDGIAPAVAANGVKVFSMDLLQGADDSPLRWRGPGGHDYLWQSTVEAGALREFVSDVVWGALDYLLVDVPPGTDKIHRLLTVVPNVSAALLVTTPSEMARFVVAKSARLVQEAEVPAGLVANMTKVVCPDCGRPTPLYPGDAVERLRDETGLAVWAELPFDRELAAATDGGRPFAVEHPEAAPSRALLGLAEALEEACP